MNTQVNEPELYVIKMQVKGKKSELLHSVWLDLKKAEQLAALYNHKRSPVFCRVVTATAEEVSSHWGGQPLNTSGKKVFHLPVKKK
jgi:hypothetical protein